jgi:hypothetical protein
MVDYVPASPSHVGPIANRMREIDKLECRIAGHSPKDAIRLSLAGSARAWTAKAEGRPIAIFGVSPISLLGGEGSPWLLLTNEAMKYRKALWRDVKAFHEIMHSDYPILSNVVHDENAVAINWLRRLGYSIGEPFDMRGHKMRVFTKGQGYV